MSIFHDPRKDPIVELMPCGIARNEDCNGLADGQCEECGKPVCRFPSCSVELAGGLFLCVDCDLDLKLVAEKDRQEKKAA